MIESRDEKERDSGWRINRAPKASILLFERGKSRRMLVCP